jgi:dGTPase
MQLFSSHESDFFRNRLTHSLEVAQIAKSIANRLNATETFFRSCGEINTDLVEVAGLAHDLGHPPFGHNGEIALDLCMRAYGGFEGNAQTLRILSRLEKKMTTDSLNVGIAKNGTDLRYGLDLCARTLAAVLKYDREIPLRRGKGGSDVVKGYYASEAPLIAAIKQAVGTGRGPTHKGFKTIECQIMDISDDIAYSTYDLEDAFKAGFLTPIQMLTAQEQVLDEIAAGIRRRGRVAGVEGSADCSAEEVRGVLLAVFGDFLEDDGLRAALEKGECTSFDEVTTFALERFSVSARIAQVGYERTEITADLVGQFISGVRLRPNSDFPALSKVELEPKTWIRVEVLKRFCFASLIMSSRLKVAERRGREIVTEIFERLSEKEGYQLLPDDFREWYARVKAKRDRMRLICDFIAGMTDRYAVEFYSRLKSETPQTIFKPL